MPVAVALVTVGPVVHHDRARQVDRREHRENVGLQPGRDEAEDHHRQRQHERHEAGQDDDDQVFPEDVAEQPHRERQHPRQVADDLDREVDRSDPGRRARRRHEVLHVRDDALFLDSVELVVHEHRQRAPQGDVDVARRRLQPRHQAHQVAEQDEDEHRPDERQVVPPLGADEVVQHPVEERHRLFERQLQLPRVLDAQACPDEQAEHRHPCQDQERHHDEVGDDLLARLELDAERAQRRGHQRAEQRVDEVHDPERMLEFLHDAHWRSRCEDARYERTTCTSAATNGVVAPANRPTGWTRKHVSITYSPDSQ